MNPLPTAFLLMPTLVREICVAETAFTRLSSSFQVTSLSETLPFTYTVALMDVRSLSAISRTIWFLSIVRAVISSSATVPFAFTLTETVPLTAGLSRSVTEMLAVPTPAAVTTAPSSLDVTFATPCASLAHTGWYSAFEGIGRRLICVVAPSSIVMREGLREYPVRSSETRVAPTMTFASAFTLPLDAVIVAVPALRGEKNMELFVYCHSSAPALSSTDHTTCSPGMVFSSEPNTVAVI